MSTARPSHFQARSSLVWGWQWVKLLAAGLGSKSTAADIVPTTCIPGFSDSAFMQLLWATGFSAYYQSSSILNVQ